MIIPLAWKVFFHLLPVLASFHGHTETEEDHLKLARFTTSLHYENCHSNDLGPLLICKKENNLHSVEWALKFISINSINFSQRSKLKLVFPDTKYDWKNLGFLKTLNSIKMLLLLLYVENSNRSKFAKCIDSKDTTQNKGYPFGIMTAAPSLFLKMT